MTTVTSYPSFQIDTPPALLLYAIEKSNPKKIAAIEKSSTLWHVIGKITPFVYTILAVGSFIASGLLAPFYLPVVGFIATTGLFVAEPFRKNCLSYAQQSQETANERRVLADKTEALPKNISALNALLGGLSINSKQICNLSQEEDLIKLRPLIALYASQVEKINKIQEDMSQAETDARELLNNPTSANLEFYGMPKILATRIHAMYLKDNFFDQKITTAFTQAVLLRPWFQGSLENLCSLNKTSSHDRALANAFNDPTTEDFVLFNNVEESKLSRNETREMSIAQLAERLIAIIDQRHIVVITS